ncbi:MAG TPA: hypothetical protein VNN10_04460 [Dehalococcoidia bacterium]|nr:hypothetical protein [Dehalococcoidia bacterium]
MSVESLPYTLLLLLGQFAAGSAFVTLLVHLRGTFEAAFIRTCTWLAVSAGALAALTALAIDPSPVVDAYPIETDVMRGIRGILLAFFLFSLAYAYFVRQEGETMLAAALGSTTAALGAIALVLMALLVREPVWSVAGPLLTLFSGALTLGAVTVAMIWGHWYLVNPRLPEGPLNEISLLTLAALLTELVITAINAAVPAGRELASDALLAVDLPENPAFWLRIGVGLVFPAVLAFMAYKSSTERAMMSATGLLYIAVGAVLAGEAVGRGLLFVTASPV